MAKKNFDALLKDVAGKPVLDEDKKTVSLAKHIAGALMNVVPKGFETDGNRKLKQGMLAIKFWNGGDINLTVEELALVKDVVGHACMPLAISQIFPILEK